MESACENINPTHPLHEVDEVNLPFVAAATMRVVLIRVDFIVCLSEKFGLGRSFFTIGDLLG